MPFTLLFDAVLESLSLTGLLASTLPPTASPSFRDTVSLPHLQRLSEVLVSLNP